MAEFYQAARFNQTFNKTGIPLKITSLLNGKKRIMGPCPYSYFELTGYDRTAEPTDMPGYHRITPPIKVDFYPQYGKKYATINLECDKRQDMSFLLEDGVMERLLEREGISWWQLKGGF